MKESDKCYSLIFVLTAYDFKDPFLFHLPKGANQIMSMYKKAKPFFLMFLCALLLFSMVVPPSASAAAKITLASGEAVPSTVYTNKKYSLKVTDTSKSVQYESSNKAIATIGANDGILKPLAPGVVTLTAKNVSTKKVVATKKITVNQRATQVTTRSEERRVGKEC